MRTTYLDGRVTVCGGDCIAVMKTLADNSVDAVVTDPPYGLEFMGRDWDGADGFRRSLNEADAGRDSVFGRTSQRAPEYKTGSHWQTGAGFSKPGIGQRETEWPSFSGGEFGGANPTCAMCGGRARGKKKCSCAEPEWRVKGQAPAGRLSNMLTYQEWCEAWAREALRCLKPGAHIAAFGGTKTYHRLACAIEDAGFEVRDQLAWTYGTGFNKQGYIFQDDDGNPIGPWGGALKPAWEPICLARKPLSERTVKANVRRWGVGALNIDVCRVEGVGNKTFERIVGDRPRDQYRTGTVAPGSQRQTDLGRWPANLVHDGSDEVLAAFPDNLTSGTGAVKKATGEGWQGSAYGKESRAVGTPNIEYGDTGSAARFFYSAKADKDDRLGSKHPTVKPVDLMQWVCRLLCPPGGTVLDPMSGTGTTGEAAYREGFNAILIERESEYLGDIERRMKLCLAGPDERARESIKAKLKGKPADHGPLFAEVSA